jgi:hypothetical protein
MTMVLFLLAVRFRPAEDHLIVCCVYYEGSSLDGIAVGT